MATPVIDIQNVTIELGGEVILRNVSLKVMPGETLVMIGPSGEGKTVLLKAMAGLFIPKEGKVLIEGRTWRELEPEEKREQLRKIGMLFQKSALFDSISAEENIAFPMNEHTSMKRSEQILKANTLLEAVSLGPAAKKLPHELSGGMQRRLGIARALALDPKILFYDDPTAGLDPVISDKIVNLIIDLKKKFNSTIVAVTNDIISAFELADRVVMVAGREVLDTGTVEQTRNHPDPRVQQFLKGELEGPLKPLSMQ